MSAAVEASVDVLRPSLRQAPDCGAFDIAIDRDGAWFHEGAPIGRPALVRLFARVLERDEDGRFWLSTPAERGRITVADAPFVAVEMTVAGEGRSRKVGFRTNLDETLVLGPDHPLRMAGADTQEPRPYVLVRGRLEARLARSVYYALVDLGEAVERDGGWRLGVWSSGCFFDLGPLPADWSEAVAPDAPVPGSPGVGGDVA